MPEQRRLAEAAGGGRKAWMEGLGRNLGFYFADGRERSGGKIKREIKKKNRSESRNRIKEKLLVQRLRTRARGLANRVVGSYGKG